MDAGKPIELVGVFLGSDFTAVGNVQVDDATAGDGGRQDAALRIVETGQVRDRVFRGLAGQQGHAVVGFLATEQHPVAGLLQYLAGKIGVLGLGFLQRQHIRRLPSQPVQHMRQAHLQRIHIPGGDLADHARLKAIS